MDNPFYQFGDSNKNTQTMQAFVGVIETMPPGFKLIFHLGTSIQIYGGGTSGPCHKFLESQRRTQLRMVVNSRRRQRLTSASFRNPP